MFQVYGSVNEVLTFISVQLNCVLGRASQIFLRFCVGCVLNYQATSTLTQDCSKLIMANFFVGWFMDSDKENNALRG